MTDQGRVFDLGYAPHGGERLGRTAAVGATVKDGLRRVLGLRRKARKKVLPFLLIGVAMIPAIAVVGFLFLTDQLGAGDLLDSPFAGHESYFSIVGTIMLLFSALAGPELLIHDREDGVLAVYSSRPMTVMDYLGARIAALGIVIGIFSILPQTLLLLGFSSLGADGFTTNLVDGLPDYLRALAASVVYAVAFGSPAILIATFARKVPAASGAYLGVMLGSNILSSILVDTGNGWGGWFALVDHPGVVTSWIFGTYETSDFQAVGDVPLWGSAFVITAIAVTTVVLAHRRYREYL